MKGGNCIIPRARRRARLALPRAHGRGIRVGGGTSIIPRAGAGGVVWGELKSNNKSSDDNALGLVKGRGGGGRDGLDMSIAAGTSLGSCWDGDSGTVTINA